MEGADYHIAVTFENVQEFLAQVGSPNHGHGKEFVVLF